MDYKKTEARRSPLKRKPLRNPGESLQEEIYRGLGGSGLSILRFLPARLSLQLERSDMRGFSLVKTP